MPAVTAQVATFQIIKGLGLFNTRWSAIALFIGTDIVSIYIFIQFMRGIPRSLDEAAIMEGASHFRVYRSIILPLLVPAIVTVVIIKGVAIYNEFYIPFLYMPSPDLGRGRDLALPVPGAVPDELAGHRGRRRDHDHPDPARCSWACSAGSTAGSPAARSSDPPRDQVTRAARRSSSRSTSTR